MAAKRLDVQQLAFFLRANPTLLLSSLAGTGQGFDDTPILLVDAGAVASPADFDVTGRYYHAIQTKGIGTDSFKIQVSVNGVDFVDGPAPLVSPLVDATIYQFTGLYRAIKAVKNSGVQTAAQIWLLSMRP